MLQNYIQTLKDLYERLSQQNLNTPADILTAWETYCTDHACEYSTCTYYSHSYCGSCLSLQDYTS